VTARRDTPIRAGLREKSALGPRVRAGLGALQQADRGRVDVAVAKTIGDSLDLDEALRDEHARESRWDYLLGHAPTEAIVALEPHAATQGEIAVVIRKREAALGHLRAHLRPDVTVARWLWVATGEVGFFPLEKAHLRLSEHGIAFVGRKVLPKHLPTAPGTPARRGRG
jgi:hypothetical protein